MFQVALQLLPPAGRLGRDAGVLAEMVAGAMGGVAEGGREVVRTRLYRPVWGALTLVNRGYGGAEVIHAVGEAVIAAAGARMPVVYTPNGVSVGRGERFVLNMLTRKVPVIGVAGTGYGAGVLARTGIPFRGITSVLPMEGLGGGGVRVARDERLRERLGFLPWHRVVLAVGDSSLAANHAMAMWAVSILGFLPAPVGVAGSPWKLLLTGRGAAMGALHHAAETIGAADRVHFAGDELGREVGYAELLGAADYALSTAGVAGEVRPVLETVGAGVPVLAVGSPTVREVLPGGVLEGGSTPRKLARRLLDFEESPEVLAAHVAACEARYREIVGISGANPLSSLLGSLLSEVGVSSH